MVETDPLMGNEHLKILFLCTGNSCRSQMAEGGTRYLRGDRIEAYSAGIETHGLNPRAVQVMAEAGMRPGKDAVPVLLPDLPSEPLPQNRYLAKMPSSNCR